MPEITPEEQVQKVKSRLLEDLEFEPEQVVNFYTRNIFQRALAHIVGWTGKKALMLRCTSAGELKTAPTTTGIEHYEVRAGTATDTITGVTPWPEWASRVDIFVWDSPLSIQIYIPPGVYEQLIEVPPGFYSVDVVHKAFNLKNTNPGANARYQLVGWW